MGCRAARAEEAGWERRAEVSAAGKGEPAPPFLPWKTCFPSLHHKTEVAPSKEGGKVGEKGRLPSLWGGVLSTPPREVIALSPCTPPAHTDPTFPPKARAPNGKKPPLATRLEQRAAIGRLPGEGEKEGGQKVGVCTVVYKRSLSQIRKGICLCPVSRSIFH